MLEGCVLNSSRRGGSGGDRVTEGPAKGFGSFERGAEMGAGASAFAGDVAAAQDRETLERGGEARKRVGFVGEDGNENGDHDDS